MSGNSFKTVLLEMYEKKQGFDIDIFLNDLKTPIPAHKLVLSLSCEVFRKQFFENSNISSNSLCIKLKNVTKELFEEFIGFIYGKTIKFENKDNAIAFYRTSDGLKCKDALEFASDYLMNQLNVQNCIAIYEVASQSHDNNLIEAAKKIFSENTNTLIASPEFLAAKPKTVEAIFSLEILNIDSELDLVKALEQYVKYHKENTSDIRYKVRGALENIRFLTLTPQEITQTSLLNHHEIISVIGSLPPCSDFSSFPGLFSRNTQKRGLTVNKIEMIRNLHDKFTDTCFKCGTYKHSIWNCKYTLGIPHRGELKKIFEKYQHTFLFDYDLADLKVIHEMFKKTNFLD
uniref:CSON013838 protein n=1 Tax=Culicoides sonorensis TaxID=179676 RepID=A0A336K6M7_CULSO